MGSTTTADRVRRLMTEGIGPLVKKGREAGLTEVNGVTIYRWATRGHKRHDGEVVVLESVRIGSRIMTSTAAVLRFLEAIQEPEAGRAASPAPRPTGEIRKASEDAEKELSRLGL